MNKTCQICGKQFETTNKRKKYCGPECAAQAKYRQNNTYNKAARSDQRSKWACEEAKKIYDLVTKQGVDGLSTYIYNSYSKKKGK